MFHLAVLEHIETRPVTGIEKLLSLDDASCMHELRISPSPTARELMGRIYERQLYKRAIYAGQDQVNAAALQAGSSLKKARAIAGEIAGYAGCAATEVLVDIPPFPHEMSMEVLVKNRQSTVGFVELSPRLRTLNETRREQWRLGVYTLPGLREKVIDAAADVLHIKKPTRQDTLF
jgi:hypothetical protein